LLRIPCNSLEKATEATGMEQKTGIIQPQADLSAMTTEIL
jgi:hypothetical protein